MSSTDENNIDNNEILDNSQFNDNNMNNDDDDDVVNASMLEIVPAQDYLEDLHNMMNVTDNNTSLKIRKDLQQTFEQVKEDPSLRSVADKIAHFEKQAADDAANAAAAMNAAMDSETTNTATAELGVYLRLRPITDDSSSTIQIIPPSSKTNQLFQVRAHAPEHSHAFKISHRPGGGGDTATQEQTIVKEYDFSHVFDETCNQETVYQQTLRPFLTGVARANQSALLFCYGMTNAGKTYTVTGPEKGLLVNGGSSIKSSEQQPPKQQLMPEQQQQQASWGLVPRALQELLSLVQTNHHSQNQSLFLSYFEIYNEHVYDLLPMAADDNHKRHHHHRRRHSKKTMTKSNGIMGTAFKGLTMHKITSLEEGLSFIVQAKKNRKSGTNRINRDSSRSHAVCQLRVTTTTNQQKQQCADMWIVDLAGSERFKRTGGTRQQEAAIINKSLMTLNRCLTALRSSQDPSSSNHNNNTIMIPWRESKLTRLFAAHWMGPYAARTCMVVNVHPSANDFDETQHVLAYATVARTVVLSNGQQQQKLQLSDGSSSSSNQKPSAVEYGYDGRRKQTMVQKVAKVIRKLSPKRALKRKADNNNNKEAVAVDSHQPQHQPAAKKMRTQQEATTASMVASTGVAAAPQNEEHNKQVNALKMALSVAQAETAVLKARCSELEEQLESIETEVRNEVAEEMETQMHTMREQYGSMMETLKARLDESTLSMNNQTDNNNEQTVLLERAQCKIQELKEQVAECEDEMKRMREDHQEEMAALCEKYEAALRAKGESTEGGKLVVLPEPPHQQLQEEEIVEQHIPENVQVNDEIAKEEIDVMQMGEAFDAEEPAFEEDIDMVPVEDEENEEEDDDDDATQVHDNSGNEQLQSDDDSVEDEVKEKTRDKRAGNQSHSEEMDESEEDEGVDDDDDDDDDDEQSRPSTRRMTRLQVQNQADSESEEGHLKTSMKNPCSERKPLGVIAQNADSQNILSDSESSDGSFGPEKWLRPKKGLKKDPSTGAFLRPRGRKPKDAEYWDENRGAWRLSDAVF